MGFNSGFKGLRVSIGFQLCKRAVGIMRRVYVYYLIFLMKKTASGGDISS